MNKETNKLLIRRLFPLYIAVFLQGCMLWYAIEKLFMHSIGFNDAGIGIMVALYSGLMLFIETPSGILADRWSRKGVLMLASVALALSSFLAGISTEPYLFLVSSLFWGIFFALYSGTYDSIVYDTIKEETGTGEGYARYYGWIKFTDSAALVIGACVGGYLAEVAGLRVPLFASVVIALLSLLPLWYFKEPLLHKAHAPISLFAQIRQTFHAVFGKKVLLRLLVMLVMVTLIMEFLYEFSQLWFIAISVPPLLFGPAFAVVLSSIGSGGILAGVIHKKYRQLSLIISFLALLGSSLVLVFAEEFMLILIAQVILGLGSVFLSVHLMHELHDALPSHVRAGASSAVSSLVRILLIPSALLFGFISTQLGVFAAAWMVVGILILALLGSFFTNERKKAFI